MLFRLKNILILLFLIFTSFFITEKVMALTCETDTMYHGLQCESSMSKSWNKGKASTAGCNVEAVCGTDANGVFTNNCTTNTCVLSCTTSNYFVCSGGTYGTYCKQKPAAVSPCSDTDPCSGACTSCISTHQFCSGTCNLKRLVTDSPIIPSCTTFNQCSVNQECTQCSGGKTLCAARNNSSSSTPGAEACVTTQSCPLGQTFDACSNTCQGSLFSLKLDYDSGGISAGTTIKQSALASPIFNIAQNSYIGIGSTSPSTFLSFLTSSSGLINMGGGRIVNLSDPIDDTDAVTKGYADGLIVDTVASSSFWQLLGNNIYYNGGSVGIGTSTPSTLLDVNGQSTFRGLMNFPNTGIIQFNDANWQITGRQSALPFTTSLLSGLKMGITSGASATEGFAFGKYGGQSIFEIRNDKIAYFNANVGIGTTNPTALLDLNQNTAASTTLHIKQYGGATGVIIDTVNPGGSNVFQINNTSGQTWNQSISINQISNAVNYSGLVAGLNIAGNFGHYGSGGEGTGVSSIVSSNNTNTTGDPTLRAGRFDAISNAAGTTAIGLHVSGSSTNGKAYGLYSSSGLNYFAGNVGIGTTTPSTYLSFLTSSSGLINMGSGRIVNLSDPIDDADAVTKGYADDLVASTTAAITTIGKFVGVTTATSTGSNVPLAAAGYKAANDLCKAQYLGSHVCATYEMMNTIVLDSGPYMANDSSAWVFNGPPGYTWTANDCLGRSNADHANYGTVWVVPLTGGKGYGSLDFCDSARQLACCK